MLTIILGYWSRLPAGNIIIIVINIIIVIIYIIIIVIVTIKNNNKSIIIGQWLVLWAFIMYDEPNIVVFVAVIGYN